MAHMIATKAMRYATRSMVAGDEFAASPRDARILAAIGKARYATKAAASEPADDLPALREEYQRAFDKRPFMGWDADTLRAKIAEAGK